MKQEDLIQKWLNNSLDSQELEAFKQLEDYNELTRLNSALQHFKPEKFESDKALKALQFTIKNKTKKQRNWLKPFLRVAAILAICLGSYYYTTTLDTTINTFIAQKEEINLPDNSKVVLNAKTSLIFNKKNWDRDRAIELNGEAYFKVAKGKKFTVKTNTGSVTVLGTEFNVKNRDKLFEVVCYEGSISVVYNENSRILKPGERFLILNNVLIKKPKTNATSPFWIINETAFTSMPFSQVIAEFERQYNVTFNVNTIDTNQLFTGSFTHNNIEVALQGITLPLNLKYTQNNNKILLKRE